MIACCIVTVGGASLRNERITGAWKTYRQYVSTPREVEMRQARLAAARLSSRKLEYADDQAGREGGDAWRVGEVAQPQLRCPRIPS